MRLTNDIFDDLTPVFLNDSTIVYSTNFTDLPDSVLTATPDIKVLPTQFNLYMAQVLKDTTTFTKLTNANSKNLMPRKLNSNSLLYLSDLYASITPEVKALKRFEKIVLAPNETKTVQFTLNQKDLQFVNNDLKWISEKGTFTIQIANSKRS